MRTNLFLILLALMASVFWACRPQTRPTGGVVLWPDTAGIRTPGFDYSLDSTQQVQALRSAKPTDDAETAFAKRDYRFIKDKFAMGRVLGAPDDAVVSSAVHRCGYKVVAASAQLATNDDFIQLRNRYQDQFNAAMYGFLSKKR